MTAQRRSEQRLAYLADHDPLTGLFNRRRFDEELKRHLLRVARHGAAGAVVLLDLDHFKFVNDTLGHGAGDVVLRAVAEALATRARAEDVLARLGGDEFALLLSDTTDREDVQAAAADILAVIGGLSVALPRGLPQPVEDVRVSASLGAVLIPPFGDPGRLLAAADLAMYEAKEAGRGQARIHTADSPHAQQVRAGFTWGERIRRSLDDNRFELWLQPIVSLRGGKEQHFEALLRLNDGEQIWLPSDFLRHAERLGLMVEIDHYVIERAIAMLAQLAPQERPTLEVNLSASSLGDEQLASWIAARLERHAVAAGSLVFEVTETVAIENLTLAATTIDKLRKQGCGFALDDFGVGVSSFYYLRELPFDILKIDGAFVRDLPTRHENKVIVRAMIDTAHGLGKTIIAEFVETDEQAEILRRLECDRGQGHLFGEAQPPGQFLDVRSPAAPGGS
jgi:diguanylate cyclase (GGDEF)-like protein